MYDCSFTEWSAAKMGPRRDIVGELAAAVRHQGLHFGASSHRAEHWWFYGGGMKFDSGVRDPRYAGLYGPAKPEKTQPDEPYLKDWLARTAEIVGKYKPELVWFDWWIEQPVFQPYLPWCSTCWRFLPPTSIQRFLLRSSLALLLSTSYRMPSGVHEELTTYSRSKAWHQRAGK